MYFYPEPGFIGTLPEWLGVIVAAFIGFYIIRLTRQTVATAEAATEATRLMAKLQQKADAEKLDVARIERRLLLLSLSTSALFCTTQINRLVEMLKDRAPGDYIGFWDHATSAFTSDFRVAVRRTDLVVPEFVRDRLAALGAAGERVARLMSAGETTEGLLLAAESERMLSERNFKLLVAMLVAVQADYIALGGYIKDAVEESEVTKILIPNFADGDGEGSAS